MELVLPKFFIIGNPRSGTTLLRLMLSSHSAIVVPPEAQFIFPLKKIFEQGEDISIILDRLFAIKKIENLHLTRDIFDKGAEKIQCYKTLVSIVYDHYRNMVKPEATIIGDKNNPYLSRISELSSEFPDARFIHIVRDGRDVALSYLHNSRHKGQYSPIFSRSITKIGIEWKRNIKSIRVQLKSLPRDQYIEVRFEDLLTDPHRVLKTLCSFLEVQFEDAMLDYYKNASFMEGGEFEQWKWKNRQPILPEEAEKWRNGMFEEDVALFQAICRRELLDYSYELSPTSSYLINLYGKLQNIKLLTDENTKRLFQKIYHTFSQP